MRRPGPKLIVPLVILAAGAAAIAALIATRPEVALSPPVEATPLVRVVAVEPVQWRFIVRSQGTVQPRNESELVPQVAGEVEWVSPALASGAFFEAGDPLVRIEPADYRVALATSRAALARAQSEFRRASTEVERQRTLREKGVASQTRIDDAENAFTITEAALLEARARLERSERDLARTELKAPFEGRVRSERVDVGQFVNRGESIATLYSVDYAEVSLPVPDRELRFVDVPRTPRQFRSDPGADEAASATRNGPQVELRAEFGGRTEVWRGHVVRTAGEIDPQTRMVQVVARVRDPYGLHTETDPVPLAVGLFVEASILGRTAEGVFVVPREALHSSNPMDPTAAHEVHVVDSEDRLRIRPVQLLRSESEFAVIDEGLAAGDRVAVSALRAVVDGMRVRVTETPPIGEPAAARAPAQAPPS